MQYKAVFFDRDQTLTCKNEQTKQWVKEQIEAWSGKPYQMDYDRMMYLFELAEYPEHGLKSVEEEIEFWHRYYVCLLKQEEVEGALEKKADELFQHIWLKERSLFPEVIEVLKVLQSKGYRLGVISDTSPSLSLTLKALGIAEYFDCFICSDLVGAMKPDPKIYQAGLDALGVKAEESIYVDDYDIEAEGARKMGFTSFHLNRSGEDQQGQNQWTIHSLKELLEIL